MSRHVRAGRAFCDRGGDIGSFEFRDLTMEHVGTAILITEYYPKIAQHDTAQPVARLTPRFHDIRIENVRATGAKQAGIIVGLPKAPITTIDLNHVRISAKEGMTISNATVAAHDFEVTPSEGKPVIFLENAKLENR